MLRQGLSLLVLLGAGLVPAAAAPPAIELWEEVLSGRLEARGFTIDLRMEKRPYDGEAMDLPVLRIEESGKVVYEAVGEPSYMSFPLGNAYLVEADRSTPGLEVMFTSYTGGAHCCTPVQILRRAPDGWQSLDLGLYDGDGLRPEDVDGDGVVELVAVDQAFLYAFDCYACSAAPLRIQSVDGGTIRDISTDPRFLDRHRAWLAELERNYAETELEKGAGYWAGWVAAKARIGEGPDAWRQFTETWVDTPDNGVLVCTVEASECPDDKWETRPFPGALKAFLATGDYDIGSP